MAASERKRELDRKRNEWRKTHRTLGGRIILYPEKDPEHINARASRLYNWFWKHVLLSVELQDIPAIVSGLRKHLDNGIKKNDIKKMRTMIGMAEDAYQWRKLEDIKDNDSELQMGEKTVYNSENGVLYRNGQIFTADYSEDESELLVRDVEGVLVDALSAGAAPAENESDGPAPRSELYKDWDYSE